MIHLKFPGKLFIMGEYFAIEKNQWSVIAAVDRFMYIQVDQASTFSLKSDYGEIKGFLKPKEKKMKLAWEAVNISYQFLDYKKIERKNLKIRLNSDLDYQGKKIGLGSSGVVVVAIMSAILHAHGCNLSLLEKFKLSVLIQKESGSLSSGGDLAASIFSSLVAYRRYDPDWLKQQELDFSLLKEEWPGLEIKNMDLLAYDLIVGWSQKVNQTENSLKYYEKFKKNQPEKFLSLKNEAQKQVLEFIETKNIEILRAYRKLMLELSENIDFKIETEELNFFIKTLNQEGYPAKVSGSGGGDCAIAFGSKNKLKWNVLENTLSNKNIMLLKIGVWNHEITT